MSDEDSPHRRMRSGLSSVVAMMLGKDTYMSEGGATRYDPA